MKIFTPLYDRVMAWSRHRRAPQFLAGLSFAESSFFPIPPDVMLAPMALARPDRAWYFALITTVASVLGGIAGYLLGWLAFDMIEPFLRDSRYWATYERAGSWFEMWGFWAIFIAGFSPIPYKLFTLSAGVMVMPFLPFVIASLIGRGARFFLVAAVMRWGGAKMEQTLRSYIDRLGWLTLGLIVILYLLVQFG
jgi:membrane protein YqaA with SNARE-associated domain